jgi:CRISPR-associated protein Csm2
MALDIRQFIQEKKDRRDRVSDYELKPEGKTLIAEVIQRNDRTDRLVDFSETFGGFLADSREGITTAQIRNIFGEIKKIEMEWERNPASSWVRLQLLRPKLAYTAKRAEKSKGYAFKEVLSEAIVKVDGKTENFQRLVNLFEAILAYHRAAGGK